MLNFDIEDFHFDDFDPFAYLPSTFSPRGSSTPACMDTGTQSSAQPMEFQEDQKAPRTSEISTLTQPVDDMRKQLEAAELGEKSATYEQRISGDAHTSCNCLYGVDYSPESSFTSCSVITSDNDKTPQFNHPSKSISINSQRPGVTGCNIIRSGDDSFHSAYSPAEIGNFYPQNFDSALHSFESPVLVRPKPRYQSIKTHRHNCSLLNRAASRNRIMMQKSRKTLTLVNELIVGLCEMFKNATIVIEANKKRLA